eukprot:277868_1
MLSTQDVVLIMILFIVTMLLIAMPICFKAFYSLYIKDSSIWINRTYRNLTMISMLSFTMTSIGDCIHLKLFSESISQNSIIVSNISENITKASIDFIYFVGNIVFYILILLRISQPFELKSCIYYSLVILILISAIVSIFYCAAVFFILSTERQITYTIPASIALSIDDFILNSVISFIFIDKMRKTIANIDPTVSETAEKNVNLIVNVIIKHSVLFGFAIFVNQGWAIMNILTTTYSVEVFKLGMEYCVRALENLTNILVLWLMLRINYNKYICICKYCHLCIGQWCMEHSKTSVTLHNPYLQIQYQ